ncbi:MAG: tagaturonate epimerase family protein [Anaerolineae bacterium]
MVEKLQEMLGFEKVYPRSVVELDGTTYFLARDQSGRKVLCVRGRTEGFEGEQRDDVLICPRSAQNAAELRARLPWLRAVPLDLATSAGCGDRLGLATPGHIRAVRAVGGIAPILAQQSMRENARTGRTPQEVMDDAMWGVFQEGWCEPWGADADHLKTTDDIDLCVAAGYTFYTIDPGDHVDNDAHTDSEEALRQKFEVLPWARLHDYPDAMRSRYVGRTETLAVGRGEDVTLTFDEVSLLRAACKYGVALAHTAEMYNHLAAAKGDEPFELEVSVDETETPTSPLEHVFIVNELSRLGVEWVSLAPRYVGRFEKGVDYIGDLETFEIEFAKHAAIARTMGMYKLSIHSGSDKFSIYPVMAAHTKGLTHLKTAGTSYLEALRAIAGVKPDLFRKILALAIEHYEQDRATYHVSADAGKVPAPDTLTDAELSSVLDTFDGREVLHVTFGTALDAYGDELKAVLDQHEEAHYAALETHFIRHLKRFAEV